MDFSFLIGLSIVIITKINTSADDIIWLPPFLEKDKVKSSIYYILALQFIAGCSILLSLLFSSIFLNEQVLGISSSVILALFSVFYLRTHKTEKNQTGSIFFVSLIGSIDELLVYTSIITSKLISNFDIIVGTLISSLIVLFVALGLTKLKIYMNIISKLDTWLVIFILAIINLIIVLL